MKALPIIGLMAILVAVSYGYVEARDGRLNTDLQNMVEKISTAFQDIFRKISKPAPDYQLQITEIRNLNDCIQKVTDIKEPCLLINLEIRNNHSERVDFEMIGKTIVTKDGRQLERYGGLYNTKELNGLCDTDSYYKLFPNARTNTAMCFPLISKSDNPILYVKMSANGKWKEYSFDLMPYIS